jgi:hypothetical protein
MKTYWIWNPYKRYWHNGKHTITDSVLRENFNKTAIFFYRDTGIDIYPEQFELFRFPPVKEIEWRPKTPEEVMRILDANS